MVAALLGAPHEPLADPATSSLDPLFEAYRAELRPYWPGLGLSGGSH